MEEVVNVATDEHSVESDVQKLMKTKQKMVCQDLLIVPSQSVLKKQRHLLGSEDEDNSQKRELDMLLHCEEVLVRGIDEAPLTLNERFSFLRQGKNVEATQSRLERTDRALSEKRRVDVVPSTLEHPPLAGAGGRRSQRGPAGSPQKQPPKMSFAEFLSLDFGKTKGVKKVEKIGEQRLPDGGTPPNAEVCEPASVANGANDENEEPTCRHDELQVKGGKNDDECPVEVSRPADLR